MFLKNSLVILIFIWFLCLPLNVEANHRNCVILPVQINTYDSSQLYDGIEKGLKKNSWCVFQNSTRLYDLLRKYGESGVDYTVDPNLIKMISLKVNSKSLVHISEDNNNFNLKIFDGTAHPSFVKIFPKEGAKNLESLTLKINESLENYSKMIPYEGVVLGLNNNVLTASAGHELGLKKGVMVQFLNNLNRVNHPLYKFATGYEYQSFCTGYVIQSNFGMSLIEFDKKTDVNCSKISSDTLVKKAPGFKSEYFGKNKNVSREKIFYIKTHIGIGNSNINIRSASENALSGYYSNLGVDLDVVLSKKYLAYSNLVFGISFLSNEEGTIGDQSPFLSDIEFGGAYQKDLFKGINLKGYFGYNAYNLFLEDQEVESSSQLGVGCFMLGAQVKLPINKKIKLVSSFGFSLLADAEFESNYLGGVDTSSRYRFYLGADIQDMFTYSFSSGLKIDSINIDFSNDQRDFGVTNITFINSINFNF